jgi:cholesterol transport system auxiliary component
MTRRDILDRHARSLRAPAIVLLAAALAGLTASCGSIIPGANAEPPKLYDLTPKNTFSQDLPRVKWQLVIDAPVAAASLNTTRIALSRSPITVDYYARAVWTDTAPKLVQSRLVESFENSGKIISVGRDAVGLRSDYVLKTEIRHFEALYLQPGPPVVYVQINSKLVKMPQRVIIANLTEQRKIQAASQSLDDVVLAFDDALGKILKRIVEWALVAPSKPPLNVPDNMTD